MRVTVTFATIVAPVVQSWRIGNNSRGTFVAVVDGTTTVGVVNRGTGVRNLYFERRLATTLVP